MTALQAAIGALNDLVDAPHDAGRKPGKPIPAGLVSRGLTRIVIVGAGAVGLALSVLAGPAQPTVGRFLLAGLALIGLGIGTSYDLKAKGTEWSWLPFALGIPLVPVFGWYGATGSLPVWFVVLVPMAVLAGAGLAIANARADLERDREAGDGSVAVRLGPDASWLVHACLLGVAAVIAIGWLVATGTTVPMSALVAGGLAAIGWGLRLSRAGDAGRRERAWQLEAVGTAAVAVGWLASVAR